MAQQLDAIVLGVGSSGTIAGLAAFFKKHAPHVELVLADPQGSILAEYIATGKMTQKGSWLVEGIGEDFIPTICDFSLTKRAYSIPDAESFSVARELLQKEGDSRRLVHRHVARRRRCATAASRRRRSASSRSPATPAHATSRSSTTTSGWRIRASSSANASAICAT